MIVDWLVRTPEVELRLAQDRLFVDITEAICEALERRGVSQAELAKRCGVSRSAISQRLSGHTNMTIKTVAETLHRLGYGMQVELVDRESNSETIVVHDQQAEASLEADFDWDNVYLHPTHPLSRSESHTESRVTSWG